MNTQKKMAWVIIESEKTDKGEYIPCIVKPGG